MRTSIRAPNLYGVVGCGVGGAKERKNHTVYLVRLVPSHEGGFLADLADVMQRRGVELFRAPRAEGDDADDADVPSAKREAAHVFPSLKKKEANQSWLTRQRNLASSATRAPSFRAIETIRRTSPPLQTPRASPPS